MFFPRGERREGLSGLSVVCYGELVIGEHLLAALEANQGEALGTQADERREARARERVKGSESGRKNLYLGRNLKT